MAKHKAVHVEGFNEDPAAACHVVTVSTPRPGPNEVLLKLLCRPINPSDVLCIQGRYRGGPSTFPFVPGFEGMGQVHEVGENLTGFTVGQRVYHARQGGTWQEYVVASAESLVPVPDSLSDEVAAQFVVNPWTAYGMLDVLKVPKGEYVLQTAAASVLGRMFIQLAHHQGIKTINIVRRNEQKEELKAIGADEVINYKEEDVVEQVKKITGGKMAYGAIECVGGELTKVVCSSVRDSGSVLVYGVLDASEVRVDISDILFRDVKVQGFHVSKWISRFSSPAEYPKVAATIMELLVKKIIVPLVGEKFPLEQVNEAILKSQASARGGKVLLVSY